MPELPEMQAYRDWVDAAFNGASLKKFAVSREKKVNAPVATVSAGIEGHQLDAIDRTGKELVFRFKDGDSLGVHLMIAGRFKIVPAEDDPPERVVGTFEFDNDKTLYVTDRAGFAKFKHNPPPPTAPDALSENVDAYFLRKRFAASPRANIKAFLMDQDQIMGIGNANSDEILWAAKIAPQSKVGALPDKVVEKLATTIHEVLNEGVKRVGALENPSGYRDARMSEVHDP